jgi:hypothetical protein
MVSPAFVFLPLYLYPYNSSSWANITAAIAANPNLNFEVVVAPNLAYVYPDKNYEIALEGLNNFTNVKTLGYVATSWTERNMSSVLADISAYAAWSNHSNPNIMVQGIFFDEVTSSTKNESLEYMKNITNFARTALGPGRGEIVYNPGVTVDPIFYEMADLVSVFENSWETFNLSAISSIPWDLQAKSIYLIHHFPGDDPLQADLINNLTDSNVGGMLITTQQSYNELSALWAEFCIELADKLDGGDMPNGDVYPVHSSTSNTPAKLNSTVLRARRVG